MRNKLYLWHNVSDFQCNRICHNIFMFFVILGLCDKYSSHCMAENWWVSLLMVTFTTVRWIASFRNWISEGKTTLYLLFAPGWEKLPLQTSLFVSRLRQIDTTTTLHSSQWANVGNKHGQHVFGVGFMCILIYVKVSCLWMSLRFQSLLMIFLGITCILSFMDQAKQSRNHNRFSWLWYIFWSIHTNNKVCKNKVCKVNEWSLFP